MIKIKKSKPIKEIKKGDTIKVNGKSYEVDAHYVLIDHGSTKEMAIEVFDPKDDESDCQLRYFDDQIENTLKFFQMKTIIYEEVEVKSIEW